MSEQSGVRRVGRGLDKEAHDASLGIDAAQKRRNEKALKSVQRERHPLTLKEKAQRVIMAVLALATGGGIIDVAAGDPVGDALSSTGNTAARTIDPSTHIGTAINNIETNLSSESKVYGKFLRQQEDGTFIVSETPLVLTGHYTPAEDINSQNANQGKVVVRREPKVVSGEELLVEPKDIGSSYLVQVAGGTTAGNSLEGNINVSYEGLTYKAGVWSMIADEEGQPKGLKGEPLKEGEKPYFVSATQTTITEPEPGSHEAEVTGTESY